MGQPQYQDQDQEAEIDLNFNDMDLVPYISPEGEYKEWDRADPDDYEAAEEIKLCGSDEERKAAVEAWKAARMQELDQADADAKAAAEKQEDDWYYNFTGMSAASWKAKAAKEQAAKEAEASILPTETPSTMTKPRAPIPGTLAPIKETLLPVIENPVADAKITAPVAETDEEDASLEAELFGALESESEGLAAPDTEDNENDDGLQIELLVALEAQDEEMASPDAQIAAPAQDIHEEDARLEADLFGPLESDDEGVDSLDAHMTAPTEVTRDEEEGLAAELWAAFEAEDVALATADANTTAPDTATNDENDGLEAELWAALEAEDAALAPPNAEMHDNGDEGGFDAGNEDGGATCTSELDSGSARALTTQATEENGMTAKELFALRRKEKSKERRAAKNSAQSSTTNTPKTTKSRKKTQSKEKTIQTPGSPTDAAPENAKPKRKYKPRARTTDQTPLAIIETHAPAFIASAPDSNTQDDDKNLEAELLAALEAELEDDGEAPLDDVANISSTSTLASISSPALGSTTRMEAENDSDAESDLGSDMSPEEWAALNGESPTTSPDADGLSASRIRPLTTIGKERVEKREKKKRAEVIRALRYATLNPRKDNILDQAVSHIQSKPAEKAREIFIDMKLSDIVVHGRRKDEGTIMQSDNSVLPKLYHMEWRDGPNYRLLANHMDLHEDVKLNEVYISLGLDICRGKAVFTQIQKLLKTPGCSLRINGDLVDEHKIMVGERAHQLLAVVGWGREHFQRPVVSGRDKKEKLFEKVSWSTASTEVFLGFSKLLYKAAKLDEGRRKGTKRRPHLAEPAVPESAEPHPSLPTSAVAAATTPMPTATDPAAPSLAENASISPTKRTYDVVDLTGDAEENFTPSPNKRARLSPQVQRMQQIQNLQRPVEQRTLYPQFQAQATQSYQIQQRLQGQAQYNQAPQRSQTMSQQHRPEHFGTQNLQNQSYQSYQNPQSSPECMNPQRAQAVTRHQSSQRRQALPQYQSPQRPQAAPQYQTPQRPQALPQFQSPQHVRAQSQSHQSPQRPWAHLQSKHNSPQRPKAHVQQPQVQRYPMPQMQMQQRPQGQAHTRYQSQQRPQSQEVRTPAQQPIGGSWQAAGYQ